jgi:hypothetical protein
VLKFFLPLDNNKRLLSRGVPGTGGIERAPVFTEAVDMNGRFQMQGGKNWILPK